jgi:lipoprotein-releasing system permease protein
MFQPLPWFIGLRYLRSRRWRALVSFRTAASLLGLALGVTALIVILSVLNGLEGETRSRLLALGAHATVSSPEGFSDWRQLETRFGAVPGVMAVRAHRRHAGRGREPAARRRARHPARGGG